LWLIVNGEEPLPVEPTAAEIVAGIHQALPAERAKSVSNWVDRNATTLTTITNCLENHIVPHV